MHSRIPLLVLGVGDPLHRDDGLGLAAVALLARHWRAPEGVRVIDGGAPGPRLLPWFERADAVVLVDAVSIDEPPGTLARIGATDEVLYTEADRLGLQQGGDVRMPARLTLLGIVPEQTRPGLRKSRCVELALPALVDLIVAEAASLGFHFAPVPGQPPAQAFAHAER